MAEQKLGQTDFLRLMTAQLKEQDPFSPVDNQAMVAQMAQFSSVAGISEMNVALKSIAEQMGAQTALLTDIKAASTRKTAGA
jgi:flagellar basal-body rod modification protein FlgD